MKKIPTHINQLTVKQYAKFKRIVNDGLISHDSRIKYICKTTGLHEHELNSMDVSFVKMQLQKTWLLTNSEQLPIRRHKTIWIGFKRFRCNPNPDDINVNRWTALKQLEVKGIFKDFPKALALLYYRAPLFRKSSFDVKAIDENAKLFAKAKVTKFLGMFFFYRKRSETLNLSLQISQSLMETAEMEIYEVMASILSSQSPGDGITH